MRHVLEILESRLLLAARPFEPEPMRPGFEVEPNDTAETATPLAHFQLGMPCRIQPHGAMECPPDVLHGAGQLGNELTGDVDYFSFSAPAGGHIALHVAGPAVAHGAAVELVTADGTVLATAETRDRHSAGIAASAALEYRSSSDGDLFLRIRSDSEVPADGLRYEIGGRIRVERNVEHEPNDSFDTANEILLSDHPGKSNNHIEIVAHRERPGASGFVRGELGNGSSVPDTDFFQFMVNQGYEVTIRAVGLGAQGGHLTVYDQDQNVVAEAEPNHDGSLAASIVSEYSGLYYVQLTDTGTVVCVTDPCLTYRLDVHQTRPVVDPFGEHEPNNTIETANPLRPVWQHDLDRMQNEENFANKREIICQAIGCEDRGREPSYLVRGDFGAGTDAEPDKDYFVFDTSMDRKIVLSLDSAAAAHVQLLDSHGNVLEDATTLGMNERGTRLHATIEHFTHNGGVFYVLVEPADGSAATGDESRYGLRVNVHHVPNMEHEPNDSIESANAIELGHRFWKCDLVCPLANAGDDNMNVALPDAVDFDPAHFALQWRGDILSGFINGHADLIACPPESDCEFTQLAGVDFFSVNTDAERHLRATLSGPLARIGGSITLYGPDGTPLASDDDGSDGLHVAWDAAEAGTYYISVSISDAGLAHIDSNPCDAAVERMCREMTAYRLDVVSKESVVSIPIEGRDEHEPNDSFEQANDLELREFPTFAPGIGLRGGDARGIAGGPTGDQDVYRFEVQAGEHVTVGLQGLIFDGDRPRPADQWVGDQDPSEIADAMGAVRPAKYTASLEAIDHIREWIHHFPDVHFGQFVVTVYDSAGVVVGATDGADPKVVAFDAAADGSYFAVVQASDSAEMSRPGHYRLGVLARSEFDAGIIDPDQGGDNEGSEPGDEDNVLEPKVVVINSGGRYLFTDSDGDAVEVHFRGRGGIATLTFTGSEADGSDIVSVEIVGVRKGGSFSIETSGAADVGSIEIQGVGTLASRRRGGSKPATFGAVRVDGNVGMVSSDVNLRSLVVAGALGDLTAHGRQIRELRAHMFDTALADVGVIRSLVIEKETATALFQQLLPWDERSAS